MKNRGSLIAALGVVLASLQQRVLPKPVVMHKPKKETNWNGKDGIYVRGRDYRASIVRGSHMPHQGEREKERRRIGGFHTRHDHTLYDEVVVKDIPPSEFFVDERAGLLHDNVSITKTHIKRVRRCPVCDEEAA